MELTRALFERHLNTRFWLRAENGERSRLDLIEFHNGHSTPRNEQFSLLFRGDGKAIHPQRTYKLEHDVIGSLDLFLVPVGRNEESILYEAVFNRSVKDLESS